MKKFFVFIILFLLFSLNIKAIDVNSKYAIVYNLNDDNIIYEKNSNEKSSIASLTKIMTTIISLENVSNLDDTVTVTYKDLSGLNGYAVAGFKAGDKVLLYGESGGGKSTLMKILSRYLKISNRFLSSL